MEKLTLLRNEDYQDNQLLETDMMRFMAIIGIVFWIIFALIKSIPFQTSEEDFRLSELKPENKSAPVASQAKVTLRAGNDEHRLPEEKSKKTASRQPQFGASQTPSQTASRRKSRKSMSPKWVGVRMQFHSLEDLLELMASHKVRLFGRAQATGFDLLFAGYPQGNTASFRGVASLPPKLWEIKSGKDHTYFIALMAKTFPAIRSFPTRQVFVSFTDAELENRVHETLTRLLQEGQNGILSITRTGDLMFHDFGREQEIGKKKIIEENL